MVPFKDSLGSKHQQNNKIWFMEKLFLNFSKTHNLRLVGFSCSVSNAAIPTGHEENPFLNPKRRHFSSRVQQIFLFKCFKVFFFSEQRKQRLLFWKLGMFQSLLSRSDCPARRTATAPWRGSAWFLPAETGWPRSGRPTRCWRRRERSPPAAPPTGGKPADRRDRPPYKGTTSTFMLHGRKLDIKMYFL